MKNFKEYRPKYIWKSIILPGVICIGLLVLLILGVNKFYRMSVSQDRQLTYAAIKKATVQCYADEGRYPDNVDYLVEHYNVKIDKKKFMVSYDCPAANISPNISVFDVRR